MAKKIILLVTGLVILIACSKSKSSDQEPSPSTSCGTKANCILGSWVIYSCSAKLKNGSQILLYSSGNSNSLLNFGLWNWIFTADGKWTEYLHGGILNDTGPYSVKTDTLYTKGKFPHSYIIADITNGTMAGYFIFDHANPDSLVVKTAFAVGIDTANLNNITTEWTK